MASSVACKSRRPSAPTRLEIEARKAEIQARNGWVAPQIDYIGEANRLLQEQDDEHEEYRDARQIEEWLPVPRADESWEMSREDIANVEFINASDLDSVFDSLIEAVSFQHGLEDCECRWRIADVNPDMMDLSDPAPTLALHDELSLEADERGVPTIRQREMSQADRCNVDIASLIALNLVPEKLSDRLALGAIDPETTDLSPDSLAALQEATYQRIAFKLKTEGRTQRDVRSFRSKRK